MRKNIAVDYDDDKLPEGYYYGADLYMNYSGESLTFSLCNDDGDELSNITYCPFTGKKLDIVYPVYITFIYSAFGKTIETEVEYYRNELDLLEEFENGYSNLYRLLEERANEHLIDNLEVEIEIGE